MSDLKWTREAPKEPGWYWHRILGVAEAMPRPVRVGIRPDGLVEFRYWWRDLGVDDESVTGSEWAGPITPPKESA